MRKTMYAYDVRIKNLLYSCMHFVQMPSHNSRYIWAVNFWPHLNSLTNFRASSVSDAALLSLLILTFPKLFLEAFPSHQQIAKRVTYLIRRSVDYCLNFTFNCISYKVNGLVLKITWKFRKYAIGIFFTASKCDLKHSPYSATVSHVDRKWSVLFNSSVSSSSRNGSSWQVNISIQWINISDISQFYSTDPLCNWIKDAFQWSIAVG